MDNRREFLRRMARGAVWVAPVVSTLSLPERLYGINLSAFGAARQAPADANAVQGSSAPGSTPPGGSPPGSNPPWQQGGPGGSSGGGGG